MESVAFRRRTTARSLVLLLVVVLHGALTVPTALVEARSHQSSPEADASILAGLGLPTLEVMVSASGLELPAEVSAGLVLVVAHNQTEAFANLDVAQLPADVSVDDFLAVGDVIPEWAAGVVLAGGLELPPMTSASAVLSLTAGDYTVIATTDPALASPSASLTVTGEADPNAAGTIPATAAIDLGAYVFDIPASIESGPQIWQITNSHNVLHHAVIFQTDALHTSDEVLEGLMANMMETPVAEGFSLETATPVFGTPILSGGQTVWIEADLAPGYYAAICFLPDPGSETPHAAQGMIATFEVTER